MKMIWGFGIAAAILVFSACSSDSDSGSGTSANNSSGKNNASQCDMATARLPASSLAWQPTFAGGCEVTQQFPLDELNALDQQIVAMGFVKNAITQESYVYTYNYKDYDNLIAYNDTLRFTYAAGFFSGNFISAQQTITQEEIQKEQEALNKEFMLESCPTLLPEKTFDKDLCTEYVKTENPSTIIYTGKSDKKILQALTNVGWTCESSKRNRGAKYQCKRDYNGKSCSLSMITDDPDEAINKNLTEYSVVIQTFAITCK